MLMTAIKRKTLVCFVMVIMIAASGVLLPGSVSYADDSTDKVVYLTYEQGYTNPEIIHPKYEGELESDTQLIFRVPSGNKTIAISHLIADKNYKAIRSRLQFDFSDTDIESLSMYDYYPNLDLSELPAGLKSLTLNHYYPDLELSELPAGLESLSLGVYYPDLDLSELPAGLKSLKIYLSEKDFAAADFTELPGTITELSLNAEWEKRTDRERNILDLRRFKELKKLNLNRLNLNKLVLSDINSLESVYCSSYGSLDGHIKSIDVSGCAGLREMRAEGISLKELNLTGCSSLAVLACGENYDDDRVSYNALTALDLTSCTSLEKLDCGYNRLKRLDLSGCKEITHVSCPGNCLSELDLSENGKIEVLNCINNNLQSLELASAEGTEVYFDNNFLTKKTVSAKNIWHINKPKVKALGHSSVKVSYPYISTSYDLEYPEDKWDNHVSVYQIQIREKGTKKWKTYSNGLKVTKTIKKLKKGRQYQVRVRAKLKLYGKWYNGKWSGVRTVKVK